MEKKGQAPQLHPGRLVSDVIKAIVNYALDQLPTVNPREIIIAQTVVNECWVASGP